MQEKVLGVKQLLQLDMQNSSASSERMKPVKRPYLRKFDSQLVVYSGFWNNVNIISIISIEIMWTLLKSFAVVLKMKFR